VPSFPSTSSSCHWGISHRLTSLLHLVGDDHSTAFKDDKDSFADANGNLVGDKSDEEILSDIISYGTIVEPSLSYQFVVKRATYLVPLAQSDQFKLGLLL
jgi:hypothetical protein